MEGRTFIFSKIYYWNYLPPGYATDCLSSYWMDKEVQEECILMWLIVNKELADIVNSFYSPGKLPNQPRTIIYKAMYFLDCGPKNLKCIV